MHKIKILVCSLLISTAYVSQAAAETPVSCSSMVSGYLDASGGTGWLDAVGTRVTARGDLGFSSFTMRDGYQVEDDPLHTQAASTQSKFSAYSTSDENAYTGYFHDVFPNRGNGAEDRWQFWAARDGRFWLRSVTWSGSWQQLQSVTCYSGPQGQLVVTGHIDNPGFGTDFWSFVMQRENLI